ncbi:hypothetical protein D623_10033884 [Myotis brandtii]|uniref:Uncharacterized protein n=1 Tax=Myotis brandtii TaxID=109478 RepID=S7N1X8_MYOBR|nr:hypothetical protein D623_10033884 [Myotis brandtii]
MEKVDSFGVPLSETLRSAVIRGCAAATDDPSLATDHLECAFAGAGQRPGGWRRGAQAALLQLLPPSVVIMGMGPAVAVGGLVALGPLVVLRDSPPHAAVRAQALPQPPPELAVSRLEEEVDEGIEGAVRHPDEAQGHRQVLSIPLSHRSRRPRSCQPGSKVGQFAAHEQQR